jgi:hypothetical protein
MIRTILVLCALALLSITAACGGGDDNGATDDATPTSAIGTQQPQSTTGPDGNGGAGGEAIPIEVSSASAATGGQAVLELRALGLPDPGLGAWTVEIAFDSALLSVTSCEAPEDGGLSFCNPQAGEGEIRLAGASATGLTGDVLLATITFTCEAAGEAAVQLTIETFADATVGNPTEMDTQPQDGSVSCT